VRRIRLEALRVGHDEGVGYTSAPPMRLQFAINPYGLKWCSLQPTQSKPQRSAYTIVST
jgi:hypothetical protein